MLHQPSPVLASLEDGHPLRCACREPAPNAGAPNRTYGLLSEQDVRWRNHGCCVLVQVAPVVMAVRLYPSQLGEQQHGQQHGCLCWERAGTVDANQPGELLRTG